MCRKCLSSPRGRSELIDSAWVVIVPGQKCIKKIYKKIQRDEQIRLESLKIGEQFLGVKIKQVLGMFEPDTVEVTDINEYIMKIEAFIDNYFDLYSSLKMWAGAGYAFPKV